MMCQDVQEKLWCAEMTEEMLDHLAECEACSREWKLVQGVGMSVEQMEVPMQTKSLLPPREVMEEVVQTVRKKRRTGYVSAGVAAACLLLALWQGPEFWRSDPAGIASLAEGDEKAAEELAGAANSSSPQSLQRDVLGPRGSGMLGTEKSMSSDKSAAAASEAHWRTLSAEQVLHAFYEAVAKQDHKTAYGLLSKRLEEDLFADGGQPNGLEFMNSEKAQLLELNDVTNAKEDPQVEAEEVLIYSVKLGATARSQGSQDNATRWEIWLVKDTAEAAWKIDRYFAGP